MSYRSLTLPLPVIPDRIRIFLLWTYDSWFLQFLKSLVQVVATVDTQ